MGDTLLLDVDLWDLTLDSTGNIAVATEPYSLAQDAASAIRLFYGEQYFNNSIGVPYFDQILGQAPPLSLMKAYFVQAALRVPGVVSAKCFISSFENRVLTGQVQVQDASGNVSVAGF